MSDNDVLLELIKQLRADMMSQAAEIERLRLARDAEVQQFNDGYQAYIDGAEIDCSPSYDNDTDQWCIGWVWAQYNALQKREACNE